MYQISKNTVEQLEFDKLLSHVGSLCRGEPAQKKITEDYFITDFGELEYHLSVVKDAMEMRSEGEQIGLSEYESVDEDLVMLAKENYVLDMASFRRLTDVLSNYHGFEEAFDKEKKARFDSYYYACRVDHYSDAPLNAILRVFDEEGEVRRNASTELSRIYKKIDQLQRRLDGVFNDLVKTYRDAQFLSDNAESWRNGRRVLVMPAENKRRVAGVIHDHSPSGKTVYLEPQAVMEMNNDLYSLENEKKAEIYRILKALSDTLRDHLDMIREIGSKVILIDIVGAKSKFAISIRGEVPKLSPRPMLKIIEARHPLLFLKNQSIGEKTIPFDLDIRGKNRMLLISGPNAGGKSVTLKTVGLIHLMIYAGIPPSVGADSIIGIFTGIYADIGDHQSIDEGLSTYSSHLSNLGAIAEKADENSLILVDEIGSGTDPKLGGAIAEAILKQWIDEKAYGIVTTHYSALKIFAFKQKGIVNGAMLFDKENLRPTYRLKVGKPGSSYAFEVAKKVGLAQRIISYARRKVGKRENAVEDLLVELQENKARLDEQLQGAKEEKERLDKLIRNYEELAKQFQVKRKKLQVRAKEISFRENNAFQAALDERIKELKKEHELEKLQEKRKEADQERKKKSQEIKTLKKDIAESVSAGGEIEKGSFVRMVDGELSGEVLEMSQGKAMVLFGQIKMQVPISELVPTREQLDINRERRVKVKTVDSASTFSSKLDIRGYKIEDADATLQAYFDKALLNDIHILEIVHGKGSGALRKLVRQKLREYNDVKKIWHPPEEMGGEGVTLIKW